MIAARLEFTGRPVDWPSSGVTSHQMGVPGGWPSGTRVSPVAPAMGLVSAYHWYW